MKTKGEIESLIAQEISHFEQECMGRGPKAIHVYLIDNLIVVRLCGVLTSAERHLAKSVCPETGRNLMKQVRAHLFDGARASLKTMVEKVTEVKVLSLHYDIHTGSGDEMVVFTIAEAPRVRATAH